MDVTGVSRMIAVGNKYINIRSLKLLDLSPGPPFAETNFAQKRKFLLPLFH